jgi:cytochrome c oxidase subunit IV
MTDPQNIASMKDMKILQLLMNADSMTGLMRTSLIISIIAAVAVAGLAFAVFTGSQATTDALTKVYHILNNTRTGP